MVLYASIYNDVPMVINLSGRFNLEKGIEERLGKEFMDRINKEGYIDVANKSGMGTSYLLSVLCSLFIYLSCASNNCLSVAM